MNDRFRMMPACFARFSGEWRKIFRKASSVSDSHSRVVKFRISGSG